LFISAFSFIHSFMFVDSAFLSFGFKNKIKKKGKKKIDKKKIQIFL